MIAAPVPADRRTPIATTLTRLVSRAAEFVFGRRPPSALPERVRRAIAADQRSSEILVCLAQFGAIAFFGGFYALTPKAFPASGPFEPVPWALGLYTVFTAFRLALALKGRLTPGFLSLSVVVDIAVLMVTIWSFHLQYQQPATIYLKAPTLLYVFILIALRAMRFEARYILLAGATAILGWFLLVAYAVWDAGGMHLTHNFAEYMTSNTILIGAEIDKLLSIAAVTGVLAIAIVRARRLLVSAAAEAHAASELSRFFAPEVAGEIRRADMALKPGDAVTREAAVMFIDLRGFTKLAARQAPGTTIEVLSEYHRRMVPAIQANGGSIDKYLGDGILASFGATRPSQTYAAAALAALDAVLEASDVITTVAPLAKKGSNQIVLDEKRQAGSMIGDPVRFREILLNLIGNACKFTENGSIRVGIDCHREDDRETLEISVADTGIGMAKEEMDKLFSEFVQLDDSASKRHAGTGLGLAISRHLAEMMGGRIAVESEQGVGSTFRVFLPINHPVDAVELPEDAEVDRDSGDAAEPRTRPLVMAVDDDPAALELLDLILKRKGFDVRKVLNGRDVLAIARKLRPDAITLDILLPEPDGWELLGGLKSDPATSDIPVVIITMLDEATRGIALGAAEFVTKPINPARVTAS
jgi:adenylate cyclase